MGNTNGAAATTDPNHCLRSGMSGGGLTKGDLKRERSCLRVYTCFGRSPEGSFGMALTGSCSASCKLDFAYLSTRTLIVAFSSSA